jgi:hypothetical protein
MDPDSVDKVEVTNLTQVRRLCRTFPSAPPPPRLSAPAIGGKPDCRRLVRRAQRDRCRRCTARQLTAHT